MLRDCGHRLLGKHHQARHSYKTTREEAEQSLHLADGLWRDHPSDERVPGRANSGTVICGVWVFVAEVTDDFILGLDVRSYDASVDLGRHLLRLGQEEVTLWRLVDAKLRGHLYWTAIS